MRPAASAAVPGRAVSAYAKTGAPTAQGLGRSIVMPFPIDLGAFPSQFFPMRHHPCLRALLPPAAALFFLFSCSSSPIVTKRNYKERSTTVKLHSNTFEKEDETRRRLLSQLECSNYEILEDGTGTDTSTRNSVQTTDAYGRPLSRPVSTTTTVDQPYYWVTYRCVESASPTTVADTRKEKDQIKEPKNGESNNGNEPGSKPVKRETSEPVSRASDSVEPKSRDAIAEEKKPDSPRKQETDSVAKKPDAEPASSKPEIRETSKGEKPVADVPSISRTEEPRTNRTKIDTTGSDSDQALGDPGMPILWERCHKGQSFEEGRCSARAETVIWRAAKHYCDALGKQARRWRLPTAAELKHLKSWAEKDSRIPMNTHPYWSSQARAGEEGSALVVEVQTGDKFSMPERSAASVRCVSDL